MIQTNIFDFLEGKKLRDNGMEIAADASSEWLGRARTVAKHLASRRPWITIENVYDVVGLPDHPNAAGSLFKGNEWQSTGFVQATRASRHCGILRKWSLK